MLKLFQFVHFFITSQALLSLYREPKKEYSHKEAPLYFLQMLSFGFTTGACGVIFKGFFHVNSYQYIGLKIMSLFKAIKEF